MKRISSKDNQYVKQAARLKNKKYRAKEQMFLLEGKRFLNEALKQQDLLVSVFIQEDLFEEYRVLFEEPSQLNCYLVDSKLMTYICDTENPQGVASIVRVPHWDFAQMISQPGLFILLDHISDPGNLGTIIRTGWALGARGVLLTPGCVDPYSPKAVRASMGGILNLPVFTDVSSGELDLLVAHQYQIMGAALGTARELSGLDLTGRKVIVIGSEAEGMSSEIQAKCTDLFKIPINPGVDSLNASVACGIILHEAWTQRNRSSCFKGTGMI